MRAFGEERDLLLFRSQQMLRDPLEWAQESWDLDWLILTTHDLYPQLPPPLTGKIMLRTRRDVGIMRQWLLRGGRP